MKTLLKLLSYSLLIFITSCSENKTSIVSQFNKVSLEFNSTETPDEIVTKVEKIVNSEIKTTKQIQIFLRTDIPVDSFTVEANEKGFSLIQFDSGKAKLKEEQFQSIKDVATFFKTRIIQELQRKE